MSQPKTSTVPQSASGGIDVEHDGFVVDVSLLARLLDVPAPEVQVLMRDGSITSRCEQGVEEDTGQFRLTFFHGNRRACLLVDRSGRILSQSIVDFPGTAASRAISDASSSGKMRPSKRRPCSRR